MKKYFYCFVLSVIMIATHLQAQNYWLELKVADSTLYYPIADIQKLYFTDIANSNSQIIVHFLDSTFNKTYPLTSIKDIHFSEDPAKNEYVITFSFNGIPVTTTFDFSTVSKFEFTSVTSVGEEISFVNITDNYPNPFENNTLIEFSLLSDCHLEIDVYDLFGNVIKNIDNSFFRKGKHTVTWDGTSDGNEDVAPGVYYCTLRSNKGAIINKMLKIR